MLFHRTSRSTGVAVPYMDLMQSRDQKKRRAGIDESLHWQGIDPDVPPGEVRYTSAKGWYCERSDQLLASMPPWKRSAMQFLVTDKGLYLRAMGHGGDVDPAWQATADRWPAVRLALADIVHLEAAANDPDILGLGYWTPQDGDKKREKGLEWVDFGNGKEGSAFTATFLALLKAIHNP